MNNPMNGSRYNIDYKGYNIDHKGYCVDTKLSIRKIKKKTFVVDGFVKYLLTVTNSSINCVCSEFSKNCSKSSSNLFCKHILFYMHSHGLDLSLLEHWLRIKHIVLPQLLQQLLQPLSQQINNEELWKIIDNEILDTECCFCLDKIATYSNYHVCSVCQGVVHLKCFNRWNTSGNGCMLCRSTSRSS